MGWLVERVREELSIEAERYYRTRMAFPIVGYGKIAAAGILYGLYITMAIILNQIVPPMIVITSPEVTYIIVVVGTLVITTVAWNISIMFVYQNKWPFFEKYRINPDVLSTLR